MRGSGHSSCERVRTARAARSSGDTVNGIVGFGVIVHRMLRFDG